MPLRFVAKVKVHGLPSFFSYFQYLLKLRKRQLYYTAKRNKLTSNRPANYITFKKLLHENE